MTPTEMEIQKLHEWVNEQSAHIHALEHLVRALVVTHSDPKALVEVIGRGQSEVSAMLNGSSLPDEAISRYQEVIAEMVSLAGCELP